jgi:hypothetical protein
LAKEDGCMGWGEGASGPILLGMNPWRSAYYIPNTNPGEFYLKRRNFSMDNIKRLRLRRLCVFFAAINLAGQVSLYRSARAEVEQQLAVTETK